MFDKQLNFNPTFKTHNYLQQTLLVNMHAVSVLTCMITQMFVLLTTIIYVGGGGGRSDIRKVCEMYLSQFVFGFYRN